MPDTDMKDRADELSEKFAKEDAGQPDGKMPEEPEKMSKDEEPEDSVDDK